MALWPFLFLFNNVIYGALISKIMTFSLFPTYRLRFWQRQYLIPVYIYIYIKKVIDHTFMSIIFWSFKVLKIAKVFFFWLRTSNMSTLYIWKEIKVSITHIFIFELESCRFFKTIFCHKHLPSIASYYWQNI